MGGRFFIKLRIIIMYIYVVVREFKNSNIQPVGSFLTETAAIEHYKLNDHSVKKQYKYFILEVPLSTEIIKHIKKGA